MEAPESSDEYRDDEVADLTGQSITDQLLRDTASSGIIRKLVLDGSDASDRHLPTIGRMEGLESLSLSYTHIQGPGLQEICESPDLRTLNLGANLLQPDVLGCLSQLKNLAQLDLFDTPIENSLLQALAEGPTGESLQDLVLDLTRVSDGGLRWLTNLPNLTELSLMQTGVGDEGMRHLEGLKRCKLLNLGRTNANRMAWEAVTRMESLEVLFAHGTAISDNDLREIARSSTILILDLTETWISEKGLRHLCSMEQLWALNLSHTNLDGKALRELEAHPGLEKLIMIDTEVAEEETEAFRDRRLDLQLITEESEISAD